MRRVLVMAGALAICQLISFAAASDLRLPDAEPLLRWDARDRSFTAAIESLPLRKAMSKLAAATGWKVFIDPAADHTVSTQFTNQPSGEGLHMLLGSLSFAVVPQKEGPSKLFVFRNSVSEATEAVEPTPAKKHGKDWLANEVIVTLRKGSKRDIEALAKSLGAKIVGRNDKLGTYRLQFDSDAAAASAREQLASAPDLRVDDNYALRSPDLPGDPGSFTAPHFDLKPNSNSDGHTIVAVVDTGIQNLDPSKSQFLLPAVNVAGSADPQKVASNVPLHGTSMVETILGSLAASSEGNAESNVRILPINVYGDRETTSTFDVTLGVYEAGVRGADIVSLSLGGDADSPLLDDLIGQERKNGILFFAAAGNAPTTEPTYPAANPLVFAVTAADRNGSIASYANRGNFIDLIAPGTTFLDFGGLTYRVTGTSPATAIVAGAAAGFLSQGAPVPEVEARIRDSFGIKR